jgi:Protein of unknown function (DUF3592)
VGLGLILAVSAGAWDGLRLAADGVKTTARVVQVQPYSAGKSNYDMYEFRFALRDGTPHEVWMSGKIGSPQSWKIGQSVPITYLPSDPNTVQDAVNPRAWWIAPAVGGPLGLLALLLGWGYWLYAVPRETDTPDWEEDYLSDPMSMP